MIRLLYSGNLGLGHELETVVRAVCKLNREVNLRVLFVGNGKGRQSLEELTAKLALDNIEFRPPVPLCRLSNLLAAGDIHLVSQKSGTQGVIVPSKIYAALAAGRPILYIGSCECEAAMIVQQSGAGIVVQPRDVNGAADALKRLALNPSLRRIMGRRARQYYEQHFGRDKSVSTIVNAIETLAQPKPDAANLKCSLG